MRDVRAHGAQGDADRAPLRAPATREREYRRTPSSSSTTVTRPSRSSRSRWPSASDRVRNGSFRATSPQIASASSCAVSGSSASDSTHPFLAPLVERHPLADQPAVVGDRRAVAGEHRVDVERRRPAERVEVGDERLWAVARVGRTVERPVDDRVRRDRCDQMVAAEREAAVALDEDEVARAVTRPLVDDERRARRRGRRRLRRTGMSTVDRAAVDAVGLRDLVQLAGSVPRRRRSGASRPPGTGPRPPSSPMQSPAR